MPINDPRNTTPMSPTLTVGKINAPSEPKNQTEPKNQKSESALYAFIAALVAIVITGAASIFSLPALGTFGVAVGLFAVVLAVLSLREVL